MSLGSRLETLLPTFSLERRVTVTVLIAACLVLGVVATLQIPIELIPRGYSEPFLRVIVPWADASPEELVDKVTQPLEEELATVRGLSEMFSFARLGFSQVFLSFKNGTDMDIAYREVRDRIMRAQTRMPDDVEQVFIRKDDDGSFPTAMVGVAVEEGSADVFNLIKNEIMLPLERIEGVAAVETQGLIEKEVLIELDRERVDAAGLNIYQIAQDLARDNFTLASGNVRAGDRKLLLRSVAKYRTPDSVGEVRITDSIRLRDIARVRYEAPEFDFRVRVNSKPAYAVMVMKEGEANTLDVARRVGQVVDRLRLNPRLRSMEIELIMDQGEVINSSLSVLLSSGRIGAVFAMLVLFFFLRRFRMSLIIAFSIPLSMVMAIVVMYFVGETLNVLSLLGLMISVGLLVDNSVVVAENIHRIYRDEGVGRREASIRGAGEIALAITTATLTTVVVFLPVALVEGQGQFFLMRLALPISVSLLASLGVALIVVPLAVYLTLPRAEAGGGGAWKRGHRRLNAVLMRAYEASFGLMNRVYSRVLSYFLGRRLDLVLLLAGLMVLTQWVSKKYLDVVPMSEDDQAFFQINIDLPRGIDFDETEGWFRRTELEIERLRDELGIEYYVLFHERDFGQIQGALLTDLEEPLSPRQVSDRILEVLPELPGIKYRTGMMKHRSEPDQLAIHKLRLYGDDPEALEDAATALEDRLARVPGVLGLKSAGERPPNELALVVDRDRARRVGVSPRSLAGTVGYALRGQPLPRIYLDGRDIPVRVRFREEDRESVAELGNFSVPSEGGDMVALSTLVDVQQLPSRTRIWRSNKQTARRITIELEEGKEAEAREAIAALVRTVDLPEGVRFGEGGRDFMAEELANLIFAAVLSIVFVYLLMGFLFESFLLPLAILITIPLAQIGVTWIHLLFRRDLDALGMVGLIILIGVVVNNGIVLLDYTRRLRDGTRSRTEAILLATERRFRPIMMTALTTICGMVPLVLGGSTRMGLSYKSFGLTLIGGMITASLLTLLVVPVFYTLFEDARETFKKAVRGAFGRRVAAAGESALTN